MPPQENLPSDLQPLCRRQAIELSDVRWAYDVAQLIQILEEELSKRPNNKTGDSARWYIRWIQRKSVYWTLRYLVALFGSMSTALGIFGMMLLREDPLNWRYILTVSVFLGVGIPHLIPHRWTIKGPLFYIKSSWILSVTAALLIFIIFYGRLLFLTPSENPEKTKLLNSVVTFTIILLLQLTGLLTLAMKKRISAKQSPPRNNA